MVLVYEIDTPVVAIEGVPSVLLDVALARDLEPHRLLRGTGLFPEDIRAGKSSVRPEQCFRLIENAARQGPAELPFLVGHGLYNQLHSAAGQRLACAKNLLDALRTLEAFSPCLSPLWAPRLVLDGEGATLYWGGACGGERHQFFLNAMMMTAIASVCRRYGALSFRWHYGLPGPILHPEQCAVHWGASVSANTHRSSMRIDLESLLAPWPAANAGVAAAAEQDAQGEVSKIGVGFIALVDDYLELHIGEKPGLHSLAAFLGISPATLKRKLHKHQSHFQARYDQVRQQLAIDWLLRRELSLEEIAKRLHYHDGRNLRRAFKRWTGMLPSTLVGC